ncbi:expressed unknown protein [Seminavis robusta]|uniref:Ribosomal RNA large subunit methyltransferase K/L-like methyltransferase domain-containing protein n=1 Tax=Seminavis robusta TaxID=568900 RepID=A0A9N8DKL0_9STRA|nr:expressed unknown protein [Seminavis robusta]|eukprot:Sro196_g083370.1 n/a (457) ;mRNA; r:8125-9495
MAKASTVVVLLLISLFHQLCANAIVLRNSENNHRFYLAKTQETFKFADLQLLQAQLDATNCQYECERLVLDAATGSTLLQLNFDSRNPATVYDLLPQQSSEKNKVEVDDTLPPSLARCEWIAEVIAFGSNASNLVKSLQEHNNGKGIAIENCTGWAIDYIRMVDKEGSANDIPKLGYTLKPLLCAIAQNIRAPASLDASCASDKLVAIETLHHGIYVGRIISRSGSPTGTAHLSCWSKRPFQYSSAIHPVVAEIVIEMLFDLVEHPVEPDGAIRILDPTCGSGTFLAFALASGRRRVHVEGWDVNPQCVQGTKQNLGYCFGEDSVSSRCRVRVRDSSIVPLVQESGDLPLKIDCVVSNLPWGQNTIDYVDQNLNILKALKRQLKPGTPCIFVHKDALLSNSKPLARLGYSIIGEATVPPPNFALPKSRKKRTSSSKDADGPTSTRPQRITVTRTLS